VQPRQRQANPHTVEIDEALDWLSRLVPDLQEGSSAEIPASLWQCYQNLVDYANLLALCLAFYTSYQIRYSVLPARYL
jgi:hypothetical protein